MRSGVQRGLTLGLPAVEVLEACWPGAATPRCSWATGYETSPDEAAFHLDWWTGRPGGQPVGPLTLSVAPGIVGGVEGKWKSPYEAERRTQAVVNTHWPPQAVSRRLADHAHIEVVVRVVWEVDGEQHVPAVATRWWRDCVFVKLSDRRFLPQGTWLAARDVRRRNESSSPPRQT